jgi:hypothetical protein
MVMTIRPLGTAGLATVKLRTIGLLAAATLVATGGCSVSPNITPSGPSAALAHFEEDGLTFDYPAAWREFHYDVVSSFTSDVAFLATIDLPNPCTTFTDANGNSGTECGPAYHLGPTDVVVEVQDDGMPAFNALDVPASASPLSVDGLPAYVVSGSLYAGYQGWTWTFAKPGSVDNFYRIIATTGGAGSSANRAALDALVASLHYSPAVAPLATDSGAADRAATAALAMLSTQARVWSCFPPPGQTRRMLVSTLPNGPDLPSAQYATCTTTIAPTTLQLWRMTLTIALSEPIPNVGAGSVVTQWVTPSGVLTEQTGMELPMPAPSE